MLIIIRSGLLAEIRWSVCISKSHRSLCVSFSRCWVVYISFISTVKLKFLTHFPVDHIAHPVLSRFVLLLCKFAAFAYVIDGFISVAAYLLFCCVLSILALIWLVLMALFCAAIYYYWKLYQLCETVLADDQMITVSVLLNIFLQYFYYVTFSRTFWICLLLLKIN